MIIRASIFATVVLTLCTVTASAQSAPTLTVNTTVMTPGQPVTLTVTGTPGQFFAVIGSSVNSGFAYAGVPLAVGNDVAIFTIGTIDGSGQASVSLVPPFQGTIFDRFYYQAATSSVPNFIPFQPSNSVVVRNGDLIVGPSEAWVGPTVNVPAGSYTIAGRIQTQNTSGTPAAVQCQVQSSAPATGGSFLATGTVPGGSGLTLNLIGAITVAVPSTLSVNCNNPPAVLIDSVIVATKVSAIH
jgi:hypothetical protein